MNMLSADGGDEQTGRTTIENSRTAVNWLLVAGISPIRLEEMGYGLEAVAT